MKIYYFSGSGITEKYAKSLAKTLNAGVERITKPIKEEYICLFFPVYCQNLPTPLKKILSLSDIKSVSIFSVYGGICYGDVFSSVVKTTSAKAISCTAIPAPHSLNLDANSAVNEEDIEWDLRLIERIKSPKFMTPPKGKKDFLADFFPDFRSRVGVKIHKNDRCISCGLCTQNCPTNSINNGVIRGKCIRCLRCVSECNRQALNVTLNPFLKKYLKNHPPKTKIEIYL